MLRALATLSVLAVISFTFSSAVALMIATHASPAEAAPMGVAPAVGGACPAMPDGVAPQCPALRGNHPSTADVVEAARRAGCPAFRDAHRSVPPVPAVPPPASIVTASLDLSPDASDTLS
jgi:hypothetical protein